MFERPSQHKVVGAANRYVAHLEARETLQTEKFLMKNEELDLFEAQRIGYSIGFGLARQLLERPLQYKRRLLLWHEQQAEGLAPGEQNIAKFALRMCSKPEKYPQTMRALSEPLQE